MNHNKLNTTVQVIRLPEDGIIEIRVWGLVFGVVAIFFLGVS